MDGLESGALLVLVAGVVRRCLLLLGDLELGVVQSGIAHSVAKESDSAADVCLEAREVHVGVLAIDVALNATSHRFDFFGECGLGCGRGAPHEHLGEHVGSTSSLKSVLTGTGTDVNTDAGGQ